MSPGHSVLGQAHARLGLWAQAALAQLPPPLRHTSELTFFGLLQVPMIAFCLPRVQRLDAEGCEVRLPLRWRTKNHLRSMYFGALAVGADVAGGFLVRHHIQLAHAPMSLIFKSFSAQFLRRPEGDVVTCCHEGAQVRRLVAEAQASGERRAHTLTLSAHVDGQQQAGPVAQYQLEVSVRRQRGD